MAPNLREDVWDSWAYNQSYAAYTKLPSESLFPRGSKGQDWFLGGKAGLHLRSME